jgi:hypothetical protein
MSQTAAPTIAPPSAPTPAPIHPSAASDAYPSDEQILGINNGGDDAAFDALLATAAANARRILDARANGGESVARVPPNAGPSAEANSHVESDSRAESAENPRVQGNPGYTPLPADAPEWLARATAAAPDSAPQLAAMWQRANALETFDRAYYGADAAAQQSLVAQLYADDPAALRAMVAAAQQIIAGGANANARVAQPESKGWGLSQTDGNNRADNGTALTSRISAEDNFNVSQSERESPPLQPGAGYKNQSVAAQQNAAPSHAAPTFDPAAYAQFEQSTNDAVVADVNRAIERALDRALPNNISDGARRRIAGDTLAEVHAALRGDRDLSAQVAQMLRGSGASAKHSQLSSSRFDSATRDAVARLIATRARTVVPEAARRVIGEWTGSVLASHRDRAAKTQTASARVDVTGGGMNSPTPRRAVAPRDINYRATSDEDILSW